jgi:hypothetical protein
MNSSTPLPLLLLSALLLLGGCTTRKEARWGHPAVLIQGQSLESVGLATIEIFKAEGFSMSPKGSRKLVFDKKGGAGQFFLHGGLEGKPVFHRIVVTIESQPGGQLVKAEVYKVRDHNDAMIEESSWTPAGGGSDAQKLLDKVKARFVN